MISNTKYVLSDLLTLEQELISLKETNNSNYHDIEQK